MNLLYRNFQSKILSNLKAQSILTEIPSNTAPPYAACKTIGGGCCTDICSDTGLGAPVVSQSRYGDAVLPVHYQ